MGLIMILVIVALVIHSIKININLNDTNTPLSTSATITVTVIKYDAHLNVLGNVTVDYLWMEANLPKVGDGATDLYCQGPTFDYTNHDTVWDPTETVNVDSRYYGKPMGTAVKDLCNLVGGATKGCQIKIMASDNFAKWFDYETVYEPDPRQGPMFVAWYNGDPSIGGTSGYVPDFSTGMRLFFFADTSINPQGRHVYGIWDTHDTMPESRIHYYYDGNYWPTSSGVSVQIVNRIFIYEPTLITCNATGGMKEIFHPGETVYMKGAGMAVNKSYSLWIQPEPMSCNELVVDDGIGTSVIMYPLLYSAQDPSGARENITTNASGDFGPTAVWIIASGASAATYDVIADCRTSGTVGTYGSYDYIDNPGWEGFTVEALPYSPPAAPILTAIAPNPDLDGDIILDWNDVALANNYTVYRDTLPITAINGTVVTLGTVTASIYSDLDQPEGTYYYVITATNATGSSGLSNCENVTVILQKPSWQSGSGAVYNPTNPAIIYNETNPAPRDTPIAHSATINGSDIVVPTTYMVIVSAFDPARNCYLAINSSVLIQPSTYVEVTLELIIPSLEVPAGTLITGRIYLVTDLPSKGGITLGSIAFSYIVI